MKLYLHSTVLLVALSQCMARNIDLSNHINNWMMGDTQTPSFCKSLECPKYSVVTTKKDYELRNYEGARWVSTTIVGVDMEEAGSQAFYRLFDYISGENVDGVKIKMTAPVINHVIPGEGPLCENNFTYSFYVPFKYQTDEGPPAPTSDDVFLSTIPEHLAYVGQFSGRARTAKDWITQADYLQGNLTSDGLIDQIDTGFLYTAGYDSPFEIFNRHNEIWFFAKDAEGDAASGGDLSASVDNKLRWVQK